MIKLKCRNCDYKWKYKGMSLYYTSCPRCLYRVKIPFDKEVLEKEHDKVERNGKASFEVKQI